MITRERFEKEISVQEEFGVTEDTKMCRHIMVYLKSGRQVTAMLNVEFVGNYPYKRFYSVKPEIKEIIEDWQHA